MFCLESICLATVAVLMYANAPLVIMDEFHYYSDKERGVAWQIPLLTMPQTQFMLMILKYHPCICMAGKIKTMILK